MGKLLFVRVLAAAAAMGVAQGQANTFVCDIPTAGCTNGMFNQAKCACECLQPFCPDTNGDCTVPLDNCGGNPWMECTRGVNCPWWVNPLKAESCTTGPSVPAGLWQIYNSMTACCNSNFAYSTTCIVAPASEQPTKHPTIVAPENDEFEVIPIKFDVSGLPDEIKMRDLKDEMTTVLKRILLRLADRIPGLKISSVEEKIAMNRNLLRALRALEQDVSLYFNVYVIRDDNKRFGPIIISEIRDSYSEVLEQIQTFTDTKYFGASLDMNWCTSQNGKFENCVVDVTPPTSPPVRVPAPAPIVIQSDPPPDDGGGLAGWAIALIIIFVLLLLACLCYFIFVSFFKDHDESKEIHNNLYMDDNRSRGGSVYSKSWGGSVNSKSQRASDDTSRAPRSVRSSRSRQIVFKEANKSGDDPSTNTSNGTKKKQARDPTMFIPGQENRPDPDNDNVLMITDGGSSRRYYSEDPPLKPKRDPTMYVDGNASALDPTTYVEGRYSGEDPPLKPKRDPTIYVEGQEDPSVDAEGQEDPSVYVEGQQDPTMYVDGASIDYHSVGQGRGVSVEGGASYSMEEIDEEEAYDAFGFKHGSYTSGANADVVRERRDPSYLDNADSSKSSHDESFKTQEPSLSGKSAGSKRSKKSKTSVKSGKSKSEKGPRKSSQSHWNASLPEVGGVSNADASSRQSKSFYK